MSVFKRRASVRQNANQGPPRRRWQGHFVKRWGIDSFSAFLTIALLSCCLLFTGLVQADDAAGCNKEEIGKTAEGKLVRYYQEVYKIIRSDVGYCELDTRYNFIAILIRALEHPSLGDKKGIEPKYGSFDDLNANPSEIQKADGLGIVSDQDDRKFDPNRDILRIEALAFTVRTYEHYCETIDDASTSHFSDRQDAQQLMRKYMDKGLAKGLISAHSHFRPNATVPRYESVAFVNKLIDKINSCPPPTGSIKVTIEPAQARNAGAKWKANGVGLYESGTTNNFVPGSTSISFTDVDSCETPSDTSVIVKTNDVVSTTGAYICTDVCSGKDCLTEDKPDYTVTSIELNPNQSKFKLGDDRFEIFGKIKNIGKIQGNKLVLYWRVSQKGPINSFNDGELFFEETKEGLDSGQEKEFRYKNFIPTNKAGSSWLGLCVEMESGEEASRTNNCKSTTKITIEKDDSHSGSGKVQLTLSPTSIFVNPNNTNNTNNEPYPQISWKAIGSTSGKYNMEGWGNTTKEPWMWKVYENESQAYTDSGYIQFRSIPSGTSDSFTKEFKVCAFQASTSSCDTKIFTVTVNGVVLPETSELSLTKDGNGKITVSPHSEKNCGTDCYRYEKGIEVTLTAEKLGNSDFNSWKNCDRTDGNKCYVTMNKHKSVIAIFKEPPPPEKVSLTIIPPDNGKVAGSGFDCGNGKTACKYEYDKGNVQPITLTATKNDGYNFSGWSGACTNSTGNCIIPTVNDHISVAANFAAKPKYLLTVKITGTGKGTVKGQGIDCNGDCFENYEEGNVNLTAGYSEGSTFTGWSGKCNSCNTDPLCVVSISSPKCEVIAEFTNTPPTVELKSPKGEAKDQPLNIALVWSGKDTEDGALDTYEVLLGKVSGTAVSIKGSCISSNGSGKSGSGDVEFTCTPSSPLDYDEPYIWTVTATDKGGLSTSKEGRFTTVKNLPPYEVAGASHEKGVEVDSTKELVLSWEDLLDKRDPEGETVTYDVYLWKTTGNQPTATTEPVCRGVSTPTSCSITSSLLEYNESYTWRVDGTDDDTNKHGIKNITKGQPWIFKTLPNNPPSDLINPSLLNGGTAIDSPFKDVDPKLPIILSWEGGDDPDNGDTVAYTVKFSGDCSEVSCDDREPSTKSCTIPANSLETEQFCSWQVTATDSYNPANVTKSEPWNFTTMGNQPPSAPTNLVLTNDGQVLTVEDKLNPKREVVFSWDASEDPEGDEITYHLYVQKDGDINANQYTVQAPNTSQVSDKLDFGSYKWLVVAEDSHWNKSESGKLSFETLEAPSTINLTANSGYANTLLDWDTDSTGIIEYRVLRVLHPEGSETIPEFGVDNEIARTPDLQYTDVEELPEKQYCYRVEGLDENGDIVSSSVYDQRKNCVTDGEVTLVIESISGTTGGEVPIEMPNGGSLQIGTADICLKYDPDVLEVIDVTTTAFSSGYTFKFEKDKFVDIGILKIKVEAEGGFGEPAVMGPGALADVSFAVKPDRGDKDYSDLEWFEASENEDLVNQPEYAVLANCITVRDDNNKPVEPLGLRDGSFTVRKATRDGQTTQARFYVRDAYSKGDVDGDGVVGTADARMATGIGVGYYPVTQDQLNAGDLNSDNKVNDADAKVIGHYALHQEWLDNDKPPVEGPKTRKRQRDGKDTPITFRIGEISNVSGSEVTTTLSVDNMTDMTAMNLAIAYNKAVVEKAKVVKAGLAADATLLYYDNKEGTVRIGLNSEQPINGSGVIAEVTLTLVSGGSVRSTPLVIAKTNVYDMFSRDFVISALQRKIVKQNGEVVLTDVEEIVIERNGVEVPIEDIITVKPPVTANVYSVSGRITDKNGKPIVGVVVTVGDETIATDNAGYYAVIGLAEGEYLVTASKTSDEGYVFVEKTCVVGNNESCRLDFVADMGESEDVVGKFAVYGTVLDRDGYPIKGATVKVGDELTTTDNVGYFAFVGLFEGQYDATVRKGTEELAEGTCIVSEESNCKLVFNTHLEQYSQEVDPKVEGIYGVQITVKDDLKQPIAGVVSQIGENIATTDETGYCEFTQFTEGEYMLTASKDGYNFAPVSFELGNQQLWTKLTLRPLTELKASIVPRVFENAEQGKHFTYIITATNGGNKVATAVSLEYPLPDGTELVEVRGDGVCEQVNDGNTVMCTLPDLVTGASAEVEIEVKVIGASNFSNVVILTSNEYPVNKVTRSTTVKPYLSVFGTAKPSPIVMNGTLHYEFAIELNDNAPEQVATGVQLEIQLPKGVALVSVPDNCEVDELVLTCQINDLSIVNPDDTSKIMFNLDVVLEDPGMIKLITKAEVTADNYPNHASKTSTEVNTQGIEVDAVILFDLTWSMTEEWAAIIREVNQRIQDGFANGATPFIAIVGFRDYNDIKLVTATRDIEVLLQKLKGLKIEGGGQCPEASADAFILALNHLKQGGTILLITDAPPYDDVETKATLEKIKEGLISKEVNFVPLISVFDCSGDNLNQLGD